MSMPPLARQESLFPEQPARGRLSFHGIQRDRLDATSWLDLVPGWLPDHDALFDLLLAEAPWQQRTRRMWDSEVREPRLVATWSPAAGQLPAPLEELREVLSRRYGVEFDSCLVNLYRDGSDAVAWHGDTVRKRLALPFVATVSLGSRRRFLLRPAAGGPVAREYALGEGDLLVMGGRTQHDWLHTVPRQADAPGARMSVTLRHSRPGPPNRPGP